MNSNSNHFSARVCQIIALFSFILTTPSWGNGTTTGKTELNSCKLQIANSNPLVAKAGIGQLIGMMNRALLPDNPADNEFVNSVLQILTHVGFSHENAEVRSLAASSIKQAVPLAPQTEYWKWLPRLQSALDRAIHSNHQRERETTYIALAEFAGMSENVMWEYEMKYGGPAFAIVHPYDSFSQWAFTTIIATAMEGNEEDTAAILQALIHFTRKFHDGPQWALEHFANLSLAYNAPPSLLRLLPKVFKLSQGTKLLNQAFINSFLRRPQAVTTANGLVALNLLSSPEHIEHARATLTAKIQNSTTANSNRRLSDLSIAESIVEDVNQQIRGAAQNLLNTINSLAVHNANCAGSLGGNS